MKNGNFGSRLDNSAFAINKVMQNSMKVLKAVSTANHILNNPAIIAANQIAKMQLPNQVVLDSIAANNAAIEKIVSVTMPWKQMYRNQIPSNLFATIDRINANGSVVSNFIEAQRKIASIVIPKSVFPPFDISILKALSDSVKAEDYQEIEEVDVVIADITAIVTNVELGAATFGEKINSCIAYLNEKVESLTQKEHVKLALVIGAFLTYFMAAHSYIVMITAKDPVTTEELNERTTITEEVISGKIDSSTEKILYAIENKSEINKTITCVKETKIRIEASSRSTALGIVLKNQEVTIYETGTNWFYINSCTNKGEIISGWVLKSRFR